METLNKINSPQKNCLVQTDGLKITIDKSCNNSCAQLLTQDLFNQINKSFNEHFSKLSSRHPSCTSITRHKAEFEKLKSQVVTIKCGDLNPNSNQSGWNVDAEGDVDGQGNWKALILDHNYCLKHERILLSPMKGTILHEFYHEFAGNHTEPFIDFTFVCDIAMNGNQAGYLRRRLYAEERSYSERLCACRW